MKVILQHDVIGLGDAGAVVDVKRGYARNYLIPRGLGLPASDRNLKRLDHLQRQIAKQQVKAEAGAQTVADKLEAFSCTIKAKAGEEDKLFGSVTTQDIALELAAHGFEIDRRQIHLAEPIRMLGVYTVGVRLHRDVTAQLKVWVVSEDAGETAVKPVDEELAAHDAVARESSEELPEEAPAYDGSDAPAADSDAEPTGDSAGD